MPGMDWQLLDGDRELMPGLTLLSTPGHTPGHQSAVVTLPSGAAYALVFDAGDLSENFALEILPGSTTEDAEALASIRRLKRMAAETGAELFLFHDPVFIQRAKLAPEYYD